MKKTSPISLFPFVSVLLCMIGALALITVAMPISEQKQKAVKPKQNVKFQWIGAPEYVRPFLIRCFEDSIVFDHILFGTTQKMTLKELLNELQTPSYFSKYLRQIQMQNLAFQKKENDLEYYPMLLVYPNSAKTVEVLEWFLEKSGIQNIGLEPMLKEWKVPYYTYLKSKKTSYD